MHIGTEIPGILGAGHVGWTDWKGSDILMSRERFSWQTDPQISAHIFIRPAELAFPIPERHTQCQGHCHTTRPNQHPEPGCTSYRHTTYAVADYRLAQVLVQVDDILVFDRKL